MADNNKNNIIGNILLQPTIVFVRRKSKQTSNIPNYKSMSPEEQTQQREKMKLELSRLKSRWPNMNITYKDDEPLEDIYIRIQTINREIEVNNRFNQFRNMFIICLLMIHMFITLIMKIDCNGLIENQLKSINKYEEYIQQLADTSTGTDGKSGWPPYIMLALLVGMNVIIYVIGKGITKYLPAEIGNVVINMINNVSPESKPAESNNTMESMAVGVSNVISSNNILSAFSNILSSIANK